MGKGKHICGLDWVQLREHPPPANGPEVRIADLFCGCGGMTLGAVEGLRREGWRGRPVLAVDSMQEAADVYGFNFAVNGNIVHAEDIDDVVPGWPGDPLVPFRQEADLVLAGPPCQGHSDLNNHTRRDDPRNSLYLKVVRYMELVRPRAAIIENVPNITHDKGQVVDQATDTLDELGYQTATFEMNASDFGVPQSRRRLVLVAVRGDVDLEKVTAPADIETPTLRDFIGKIAGEHDDRPRSDIYRTASRMGPTNVKRAKWLRENDAYDLPNELRPPCHRDKPHSYVSMYGRMRWDVPAQTLTTGFGSMGQGRYLHPDGKRVITPHEAARIQGFPDFFDFSSVKTRTALQTMIGNAVPPQMTGYLVSRLVRAGVFDSDAARPEVSSQLGLQGLG